jgi:cell division protein FtsI/penicillin-binding protein 2
VVSQIKAISGDLVPAAASLTTADPTEKDDTATGVVNVDWRIAENLVWHYQSTVPLARKDGTWRVVWVPADIHPELAAGDTLAARVVAADRGAILDGAGQPIVQKLPIVNVGVQPSLVKDTNGLIRDLDAAFKSIGIKVDLADLPGRLGSAGREAFVDVVTLRRPDYERIKARIQPLDGTVFTEGFRQLAPSRAFARALLGTVGEVTKEQLDKSPGMYVVGDQVGQFGLQAQYDRLLRGTSGVKIVRVGKPDATGKSAEKELFQASPKPGQAIRTMLDQKLQAAADAALVGQPNRAAVVAVRVSDGAIVAAANGPDGGDINLAFTASVPPGSTFKMVTALGALNQNVVGIDSIVDCPKIYNVGGRNFNNDHNFELGSVKFRVDFAKSCNTAFASLGAKLGPDGLQKAAASVGVGTAWNLGAEVSTGSVQANPSNVEAAAAAFGQGQTVVSPLALAGAAAAVARGSWTQPKLFAELPPGAPGATKGLPAVPDGTALNATSVTALKTMMREVVTGGTATALGDVPGGPVYCKTGTAQFDDNDPNASHAWTIGWRGDIAFAVFVEKGGSSTSTAVPIVEKFLRAF